MFSVIRQEEITRKGRSKKTVSLANFTKGLKLNKEALFNKINRMDTKLTKFLAN